MAVSPVVTYTAETVRQHSRPVSSPLKIIASGQTSSDGTPRPALPPTSAATLPVTMDLAEQMNEEEKRQYVKG